MKRTLLALALLLLPTAPSAQSTVALSAPTYNWGSGWCTNCYLYEYVDIPNAGTGWTSYFAGWAAHGFNGQRATRIDLWIDGRPDKYAAVIFALPRPDLTPYTGQPDNGWAVYPTNPLAPGPHTFALVFWYGMVSTTQHGTVVVP